MLGIASHHHYTYTDYLIVENSSSIKHEYFGGEMFAMAGGTPEHAALCARVIAQLSRQLDGKACEVYTSDLRILIPETGLTTYPDVSVVCGAVEHDAVDPCAATNPTLIVEVLSDSTERYDRGTKFEHYQRLPSLRAYLLVASKFSTLDLWQKSRSTEVWEPTTAKQDGALVIDCLGARIEIGALYRGLLDPVEHPSVG